MSRADADKVLRYCECTGIVRVAVLKDSKQGHGLGYVMEVVKRSTYEVSRSLVMSILGADLSSTGVSVFHSIASVCTAVHGDVSFHQDPIRRLPCYHSDSRRVQRVVQQSAQESRWSQAGHGGANHECCVGKPWGGC